VWRGRHGHRRRVLDSRRFEALAMYEVEANGVKKTHAALINVGKRANDVRPAFADVRAVVRESNEARFGSRGDGSWPPLKDSTKAAKARHGQDPRVLRASGALFKSLTANRAKGQVNRKKPDLFRIGTSLYYARFHDLGEGGVPVRKLMDLTDSDMRKINGKLEDFIANDVRQIQSML
jgi:phage gpG-like protein